MKNLINEKSMFTIGKIIQWHINETMMCILVVMKLWSQLHRAFGMMELSSTVNVSPAMHCGSLVW